jgi:hypothetical protein
MPSISTGSTLEYVVINSNGADIIFPSTTTINLADSRIYLVSYIVTANIGASESMSITPRINGNPINEFASTANTSTANETTASGAFLLNTILFSPPNTLDFLYTGPASATNVIGTIAIVEIQAP